VSASAILRISSDARIMPSMVPPEETLMNGKPFEK
jgi:hypothetical protein